MSDVVLFREVTTFTIVVHFYARLFSYVHGVMDNNLDFRFELEDLSLYQGYVPVCFTELIIINSEPQCILLHYEMAGHVLSCLWYSWACKRPLGTSLER